MAFLTRNLAILFATVTTKIGACFESDQAWNQSGFFPISTFTVSNYNQIQQSYVYPITFIQILIL